MRKKYDNVYVIHLRFITSLKISFQFPSLIINEFCNSCELFFLEVQCESSRFNDKETNTSGNDHLSLIFLLQEETQTEQTLRFFIVDIL
jgi:hypothetical protein